MFKLGLKTYFKEYAFKATTLDDFYKHMDNARKTLKIERDFTSWADKWIKYAGCNQIWHEVEEENGKIKKFTVHQRIWKEGEGNCLRVQ